MTDIIEKRPGANGRSTVAYPPEWTGKAPYEAEALRVWIRENIRLGIDRRARGENVPWLAREAR